MSIYQWVSTATGYIPFKGDRAEVSAELHAHYEDHVDALMAAGLDRQNAELRALEAMGDPDETGRLLRKVHRPWLGLVWTLSRWALGVAMALCLIFWTGGGWYGAQRLCQGDPRNGGAFYSQNSPLFPEEDRMGFILTGRGVEKAKAGSYTVSVENVTAQRMIHPSDVPGGGNETYDVVFFLIKIKGPVWLDFPENIRWFITAVDAGGSVYKNDLGVRGVKTSDRSIAGNPIARRLGVHYLEMWLSNCDAGSEWYELRYDHDGTSFAIRTRYEGHAVQ